MGPETLAQVLGRLPKFYDENLLVGIETSDDAAIYKVTDEIAMIQTVDFFTPIVDDPYMFGQIAAANSLSDVWAMGGEPAVALNIVGFPNCLDPAILGDILAGGADKVKEAGAVLVGGHSVQDEEPKYGLCVSGFVHPDKIFKNFGCRPGDVLILTKQIGSGVVNTAIKGEIASPSAIKEAQTVMASLNKKAKQVVDRYRVSACTDITGFGLLGHCVEMASASEVTFDLRVRDIAYFEDAIDYAKMGLIPAGAYKNKGYSLGKVEAGNIEEHYLDLLYDPQTSGGLLISVAPEEVKPILEDFKKMKMDTTVSVIGTVAEKSERLIRLW
ncbi:selenide, water dikinase SelD [Suipraeoptans intestinalis]|uniref:selenide, water dikinase SelD n=1 Tax=Suipraeoptans intestinalis TaxID=2606628 RepID=UPI0023F02EA4|nr:selenide, water dikinase SelD [Suipraeoptans intestinalis]MDD7770755.1 selenide, water dikinase SelD [Suipraeoptans intestinalis]